MLHIFEFGGISGVPDHFFVAAKATGPRATAAGATREAALVALLAQLKGEPAVVGPELAALGKAHGLESAERPEPVKQMRAVMAAIATHGPTLKVSGPEVVSMFLEGAAAFFKAAPWKIWHDEEPIEVVLEGLRTQTYAGVIMGGAGEEFGLALYEDARSLKRSAQLARGPDDSLVAMTATEDAAFALEPMREALGLAVVPLAMRVKKGKFPVLVDEDLLALAAALRAASQLRRDRLSVEARVALHDGRQQVVRLRIAAPGSRRTQPETVVPLARHAGPQPEKVSRNALCPCGSGLKYKRCHGVQASAPEREAQRPLHERILAFGQDHFGNDWFNEAQEAFPVDTDLEAHASYRQLFVPWLLYVFRRHGEPTACQAFLAQHRVRLNAKEIAQLEGQHRDYLTAFEIARVEEGVGMELVDQLTGERVYVHERMGSRGALPGLGLLARLADLDGRVVIEGMHPNPLRPLELERVLQVAREHLKVRGKKVPLKVLSNGATDHILIQLWELALKARDREPLPRLQNMDGDPLVDVTDRFSFDEASRPALLAALGQLAEHEPEGPLHDVFVFLKKKRGTPVSEVVAGRVELRDATLSIRANSVKRATALRKRVEKALGPQIQFIERSKDSAEAALRRPRAVPDGPPVVPVEVQQAIRELKAKHYASWPDEPLEALGGLTPRKAAQGAKTKDLVRRLLQHMEQGESQSPAAERFDFAPLRRALKLE
jgi:hypothetical protein